MKRFSAFLLIIPVIILFSGCRSAASLDRKPVKKAPAKKMVNQQNKQIDQDKDPLFDAVFKRKPQQLDGDSKLSDREKKLLRQSDVSQDPYVKQLHKNEKKNRQQGADWVFGTKDGSYF